MGQTYYIFRHGETFATKRYRGFYGWRVLSAPILAEGIPTIERIGTFLKTKPADFYVTSKLLRCVQTAKIVGDKSGVEFVLDKRLNEYFLETFGHFRRRMESFIFDMSKENYKNIVVCTHGAGIAALTHLLTEQSFQLSNILNYPSPGVLTIIKEKKIEKIDFNTV